MVGCYVCASPMQVKLARADYPIWSCPACKFECTYPQPDDTVLAHIYEDRYFDFYVSGNPPAALRSMKQASYARFLAACGALLPGCRLLDCGASTGSMIELATAQGLEAYAIELSHFGAEACRRIIGADHVYEGNVEDARFAANPDNCFDVITMMDFIEHVRDPRTVLQWARAHLAPRGHLLIVTPKVGSLSHRLMGRYWTNYILEHLCYFGPRSIGFLLRECGFSIQTIQTSYKKLTLQYIINRSFAYQYPLLAPLCRLLQQLLPQTAKNLLLSLPTGDMFVYAYV